MAVAELRGGVRLDVPEALAGFGVGNAESAAVFTKEDDASGC